MHNLYGIVHIVKRYYIMRTITLCTKHNMLNNAKNSNISVVSNTNINIIVFKNWELLAHNILMGLLQFILRFMSVFITFTLLHYAKLFTYKLLSV